jgi:HD superfamily phosphohydrolase
MITAWQDIHRVSRRFNAMLNEISEFIAEVHEVLGDRPILYPSYIGSHCLIPNTRQLTTIKSNNLWKFILESNEKRLEELKNNAVRKEIDDVKNITKRFTPNWYFE